MNIIDSIPVVQPSEDTRRKGFARLKKRILILGSGKLATDLCDVLLSKKTNFVDVVGFLDHDPNRLHLRLTNPDVIGTYDQLFEIVEKYRVHAIAVCLEDRRSLLPVQTLLDLKAMGLDVVDGHHLYEEESGRLSIDLLRPSALIFSAGFRRRAMTMGIKRFIDVVVSILGLGLLTPVFVLVGILIKLDSPGPVFYRQMRVGLGARPYMIWKFRSMSQEAEKQGPRWADVQDPRVSRVGKWLRKARIDELPQFVNVLKGDMSLVGPRPERPVFVQELRNKIPYYDMRHTVRPGITGWAQIRFGYAASPEDAHMKLQYDLYYVKNLTIGLDLRILIETARVVLLVEGAR